MILSAKTIGVKNNNPIITTKVIPRYLAVFIKMDFVLFVDITNFVQAETPASSVVVAPAAKPVNRAIVISFGAISAVILP